MCFGLGESSLFELRALGMPSFATGARIRQVQLEDLEGLALAAEKLGIKVKSLKALLQEQMFVKTLVVSSTSMCHCPMAADIKVSK